MKKKYLWISLIVTGATALCGCQFFDIISISGEGTSSSSQQEISVSGDGSKDKQTLMFTLQDYTENSIYSISSTPTLGNPKLLVIPVLFTDSGDFIPGSKLEEYRLMLEKAIFGTKEETGWHSVKTYYEEESLGKCLIDGMVSDWYQSTMAYDVVTNNSTTSTLVKNAVEDWKNKHKDLVEEYDSDVDGFLDGVIIVYGGPNYKNVYSKPGGSHHKEHDNMWAYTGWTDSKRNVENPAVKNYIWASYDFMLNDLTNVNIDTHTYIHETGHLFGLDDYYDYNDGDNRWAGAFSMQDYNVGGHDPYSMLLYGWADPYVPTESCTIEINPFVTSKDLILLTPQYTASPFDEYLLIELYTPTGVNELDAHHAYNGNYPTGLTSSGIRLWHIDSRLLDVTKATSKKYDEQGGGSGYTLYTNYTVTTSIESNKRYVVGPTNTQFTNGGTKNGYSTTAIDFRPFRLIELIRRNDYAGFKRGNVVKNDHLFKTGDTFNINNYSNYFVQDSSSILYSSSTLNSGLEFPWTISFDKVTTEKATITLTKK